MLRHGVTIEQRWHKLYKTLVRQHTRNPTLLPITAIAAFLLISLLLYLLSAPLTTATPTTTPTTPPHHASITPPQPQQPLTVRALAVLRNQLEARIVVHDFEACIVLRRMMALVGEDREAGRREGTGEAEVELDTYIAQLRQRAEEEAKAEQAAAAAAEATTDAPAAQSTQQRQQPQPSDDVQQQMAAKEAEWKSKVAALQQEVRDLQAKNEARAAAKAAADADNMAAGNMAAATERRTRRGASNERITFGKVKSRSRNDEAEHQQQQQHEQPPQHRQQQDTNPLDIIQSPEEEATAQRDKQSQQQPQPQQPQPQQPQDTQRAASIAEQDEAASYQPAAAGAPDSSEQLEAVRVAGVQSGVRRRRAAEEGEEEEGREEKERDKRRRKRRWLELHGKEKQAKEHDDDD